MLMLAKVFRSWVTSLHLESWVATLSDTPSQHLDK